MKERYVESSTIRSNMRSDLMIEENLRRHALINSPYDPMTGEGSPIDRDLFTFTCKGEIVSFMAPLSMLVHPFIKQLSLLGSIERLISESGLEITESGIIELFSMIPQIRFDHDFEYWAYMNVKIQDKESKLSIPFRLNRAQRRLLAKFEEMRRKGIPIRVILLKARQWGGSTLTQIYMCWIQNRHQMAWHSSIVTDVEEQARNIRNMYSNVAKHYPPFAGTITLNPYAGSSKSKFVQERECIIGLGSAQRPDSLRSFDFAMLHLCLNPNTLIPSEDGFLKRAEEICIGDSVITHTGKKATVSCVTISKPSKLNGNGKSVIVRPWLGYDTELTPNHPIFTNQGWIRSDELTKKHLLAMPIRQISHSITHITLPSEKLRPQGGGKKGVGYGAVIELNEEIGFAFGYYLAEGSLHYSNTKKPNEITLTRHNDEFHYADRAIAAFNPYISSHCRKQRKGTLTTHEHLYSASLSVFISDVLGVKEKKRIPDWFFDCGVSFLTGLIKGYLSGDGSKSNGKQGDYVLSSVSITTVSSSLATQVRDIIASLSLGWGAIDRRNKGIFYGRNCKETFILRYTGIAARNLRGLMGLSVPDNGRQRTEKYHIHNGHVWFKIKDIRYGQIDRVVDIEVDHEDHSFRTLYFTVKNSEVGLWKDTAGKSAADLAQSLQATVPNTPMTMVVMESTAKGVGNYFHKQWQLAESGGTYQPVFIAWYEIERYQMPVPNIEAFISSWGEKEWFHWNLGATIEAVYWYKTTQQGEGISDWAMCSEYPSTAAEAFQSTGRRAFAPQYVLNARESCCAPSYMGDLYADAINGAGTLENIDFKETPGGRLWIWEKPDATEDVSDRYCLFADIGGRTEKADFSVIKVLDRYWMMDGGVPTVVAVWYGHLDQDLFAWKCAQLAKYYNNGLLAIESNSLKKEKAEGNHFLTVLDKIAPHYENLYTRDTPEDVRNKLPAKYGFHTNISTKPMIIDCLNANLRDEGYIERDIRACDEMDYYEIKPDGSYGAIIGQHDDHVMTTAGVNWISSRMPLPVKIQTVSPSWNTQKRAISEATI